ncbi:MAG: SCO family protein [Arachnia sp.]
MIRRRTFLGAGGLVLLSACGQEGPPVSGVTTSEWHGTHLSDGGAPLPDVTLTDQHGQPYNLAKDPKTKAVALFFGYTNCPDVCPGIMADMATAKRRLPEALVDDVTLILVTTDPARDTPEALAEYLARVDESFIGLTGDLEAIKPAALSLGVDIAKGKELPSGGYEVDHGSYVLGFGEDRKLAVVWNQASINDLKEDFVRLIG